MCWWCAELPNTTRARWLMPHSARLLSLSSTSCIIAELLRRSRVAHPILVPIISAICALAVVVARTSMSEERRLQFFVLVSAAVIGRMTRISLSRCEASSAFGSCACYIPPQNSVRLCGELLRREQLLPALSSELERTSFSVCADCAPTKEHPPHRW